MPKVEITRIPPTPRMINYMEILFNDTGFMRESRNAWLTHKFKRLIHYLDELGFAEGREVIQNLKVIRGDKE